MTVYRDSCGTLRGRIDHQSAGEDPCGWCVQAEATARLASEAVTRRPVRFDALEPVSEERARANAAALDAEVEAYERDHRGGRVVGLSSRRRVA
jgi:hypothetical protein